MKHKVCVFSSSSSTLASIYYDDAKELGNLLGQNNMDLVYGGSKVGTMYEIAKAAKANGAKIIGVMPEKLYNFGVSWEKCDEFHLTNDMRKRKALLDKNSDCIIAMAGGFGTLDEIAEMIVQKQLGYNNRPIIFLNTNGFYNNLLNFFDDIINQSFAKESAKDLYYIANNPQEAINYILNYDFSPIELSMEDIYTKIPESIKIKTNR